MYIGLTGSMASGKSTVAKRMSELGAYVIDADAISREVTARGTRCIEEISRRFGAHILNDDGELCRAELAGVVFNDEKALADLNEIVHPAVKARMLELANQHELIHPHDIIVFDVPLLIETGMNELMDEVWLVTANKSDMSKRAMLRDKMSEAEIEKRICAQADNDVKRGLATVVIENTGTKTTLYKRVDALYGALKKNGKE